jgi:ubiquinone/menaquinone biosynthesis C-methylase UbiE
VDILRGDGMDAKDVITRRWDRSSKTYDSRPGHGIQSEREKEAWKSLLNKALGVETLDILDVGCGTGVISLVLSEMGHNVIGVDLSEEMLKRAKEKAHNQKLRAEFQIDDAENLSFENESFDAVINRHLLWTLLNPERAVTEWKRVLKPGGKLIIIDGNGNNRNSLRGKIHRYFVSIPLILLTELRNPCHGHYGKGIEGQLPMRKRRRPEADVKILKDLGFNVEVIDVNVPRNGTLLNSLKYGPRSDRGYFLVKGIKNTR